MSNTNDFSQVVHEWAKVFMHRSMSDFKNFMQETGLSFSHVNILMRLFHGRTSGVSEIGNQMGITNAAASQTVDRLVQMGLIVRTENPDDRRAKRLELTPKGRGLIEKGIHVQSQWVETLTARLSTHELDMITTSLTILTNAARETETSNRDSG
ncbi:MarR family winged helix-turn-helix transcriptional regulator [Chloroflexota bacterium]